MANFTLDYTGEEVNALLGQVAAGGSGGGGVMRVNVLYEDIEEGESGLNFINVTLDKTYEEIMSCIENGGFPFAVIPVEGPVFVPVLTIAADSEFGTIQFSCVIMDMKLVVGVNNSNEVNASLEISM